MILDPEYVYLCNPLYVSYTPIKICDITNEQLIQYLKQESELRNVNSCPEAFWYYFGQMVALLILAKSLKKGFNIDRTLNQQLDFVDEMIVLNEGYQNESCSPQISKLRLEELQEEAKHYFDKLKDDNNDDDDNDDANNWKKG